MKQVMNYHKDNGLLNMIRRTDPMIKRDGSIGGDMAVLHYYDKKYPNNHINYAIYTLYVGTWGYYPYDKNTKPDAIRGKQTELPEIFVPNTRR
jgi:hypothetical protein